MNFSPKRTRPMDGTRWRFRAMSEPSRSIRRTTAHVKSSPHCNGDVRCLLMPTRWNVIYAKVASLVCRAKRRYDYYSGRVDEKVAAMVSKERHQHVRFEVSSMQRGCHRRDCETL